MTVTMLVPIAGNADPRYDLPDFSFMAGQTVEVDDTLAAEWIAPGIAQAAS